MLTYGRWYIPASGVLTLSNIKVTPVIRVHIKEYLIVLIIILVLFLMKNKAIKKKDKKIRIYFRA